MNSIAFFTNKGGVGKTTLLCNVAACLTQEFGKKVLVVDADPQANATQYMFSDSVIDKIYDKKSAYTIYSMARPLSQGKGYSEEKSFKKSPGFNVDVLLGDPRLALIEDTLAGDWASAGVRGMRTTFMFRELLSHCGDYDLVLFDVGPSLGSINRSVLIGCDYFVLPLSTDIFSVRATENISTWMKEWRKRLDLQIASIDDVDDIEVSDIEFRLQLLGYVTQQYQAKRNSKTGEKRAVKAYEKVMSLIPQAISRNVAISGGPSVSAEDLNLGSIPNLHSLVAMSQIARKPIFGLKAADGVVGAHFVKVSETLELYRDICENLLASIEEFPE